MIGRRRTILYGAMIFFVGGALQTFANGMPMMILGRIIAGLGVGALSTIVPVYQSEISPPHNRGKLACIEFTGNISGYAASVWVDYGCTYIQSNYSWRIPLLLQCVMGALLGVGSLIICESPRSATPPRSCRISLLTILGGSLTTITMKRASSSSQICTGVATSTTTKHGKNTERSR